jgi:hypothetical protein
MPVTETKTEIKVSGLLENEIRICSIQWCCKNHLLVMTYFLLW